MHRFPGMEGGWLIGSQRTPLMVHHNIFVIVILISVIVINKCMQILEIFTEILQIAPHNKVYNVHKIRSNYGHFNPVRNDMHSLRICWNIDEQINDDKETADDFDDSEWFIPGKLRSLFRRSRSLNPTPVAENPDSGGRGGGFLPPPPKQLIIIFLSTDNAIFKFLRSDLRFDLKSEIHIIWSQPQLARIEIAGTFVFLSFTFESKSMILAHVAENPGPAHIHWSQFSL